MLIKIIIILVLLVVLFGPWKRRAAKDKSIKIMLVIAAAVLVLAALTNMIR